MLRESVVALALVMLAGCGTQMKVVKLDDSGHFPTKKEATVVTSVAVDLDERRGLLVAPNGDFTADMVRNIGYFDEVINFEELEKRIVTNNLTDKVPSLQDRIGINNAARHYRPFLWLHWDSRKDGTKVYQQLKLVDALTLDEYFVAETYLDVIWAGVTDQNNAYPAMNALIDYLRANSATFGK